MEKKERKKKKKEIPLLTVRRKKVNIKKKPRCKEIRSSLPYLGIN